MAFINFCSKKLQEEANTSSTHRPPTTAGLRDDNNSTTAVNRKLERIDSKVNGTTFNQWQITHCATQQKLNLGDTKIIQHGAATSEREQRIREGGQRS